MRVNHAVGSLIRENKMFQLVQVLTTSVSEGMFNFERCAAQALLDGKITPEDAERISPDRTVYRQILGAMRLQRARKLEEAAAAREERARR